MKWWERRPPCPHFSLTMTIKALRWTSTSTGGAPRFRNKHLRWFSWVIYTKKCCFGNKDLLFISSEVDPRQKPSLICHFPNRFRQALVYSKNIQLDIPEQNYFGVILQYLLPTINLIILSTPVQTFTGLLLWSPNSEICNMTNFRYSVPFNAVMKNSPIIKRFNFNFYSIFWEHRL